MRVLLSAGWLGGAGGAERAAHSIIRALAADHVDVVARQRLGGRLGEVGEGVRVFHPLGWRWRYAAVRQGLKGSIAQEIVNRARRRILPHYDAYLQLLNGPNLSRTVRADIRLLVPSGQPVPAPLAADFDYVALQAPDNERLLPIDTPTCLLPPPVYPISEVGEAPSIELPDRFFLTVFNPYGGVKGTEDLVRIVDELPYPIAWCHSQATMAHELPPALRNHPNITHVEDASPEQMRYLYERCLAYLSFSRSEGFGWAIADALRHSPAVVAREVGVLTMPEVQQAPVHFVKGEWSVDWSALLDHDRFGAPRDLAWLSPERFRDGLLTLLATHDRARATDCQSQEEASPGTACA